MITKTFQLYEGRPDVTLTTYVLDRHDYAAAGAYLDEALTIQRAVGDKWAIANALNTWATCAATWASSMPRSDSMPRVLR